MPRLTSGLTALSVLGLTALAPLAAGPAAAAPSPHVISDSAPGAEVSLSVLGSHRSDVFDQGAAEIVAHYAAGQQTLVVNAQAGTVQVLDSADPRRPQLRRELPTAGMPAGDGTSVPQGAVANSVAVRADGLAAVALEAPTKTDPGWVGFFDLRSSQPTPLGAVSVGALPDSVVFDPAGRYAVVANEGEPAEDYAVDPEGTVSVITLPEAVAAPSSTDVRTADFHAFEGAALPDGVRVYGGRADAGTGTPEYPVSENLEPEYSTVIGGKAYVTVQEANAIAVVDLAAARVEKLLPAGTQDFSQVPVDASDKDGRINRRTWPVRSFLQPDTIRSVELGGREYLLTANEGDSRDWKGYSEEARVKDLGKKGLPPLCPSAVSGLKKPDGTAMSVDDLTADENLGRLTITTADGLSADGSCFERLFGTGGRSFSIVDTSGHRVFDSADDFERITAAVLPEHFNSNNTASDFDSRSDDKGPEPEAIEVGRIGAKTFAFIGLERIGGVFVYDITEPRKARYVTYVNNRDFSVQPEDDGAAAGDSGPESIVFVPRADLPGGSSGGAGSAGMLIVGNEVTGSTTFYAVDSDLAAEPTSEPTSAPPSSPSDPTAGPTADPSAEPTSELTTEATGPGNTPEPSATQSDRSSPRPSRSTDPRADDRRTLPRTGAQVTVLVVIGLVLTAAGGLAVWIVRRRN